MQVNYSNLIHLKVYLTTLVTFHFFQISTHFSCFLDLCLYSWPSLHSLLPYLQPSFPKRRDLLYFASMSLFVQSIRWFASPSYVAHSSLRKHLRKSIRDIQCPGQKLFVRIVVCWFGEWLSLTTLLELFFNSLPLNWIYTDAHLQMSRGVEA